MPEAAIETFGSVGLGGQRRIQTFQRGGYLMEDGGQSKMLNDKLSRISQNSEFTAQDERAKLVHLDDECLKVCNISKLPYEFKAYESNCPTDFRNILQLKGVILWKSTRGGN